MFCPNSGPSVLFYISGATICPLLLVLLKVMKCWFWLCRPPLGMLWYTACYIVLPSDWYRPLGTFFLDWAICCLWFSICCICCCYRIIILLWMFAWLLYTRPIAFWFIIGCYETVEFDAWLGSFTLVMLEELLRSRAAPDLGWLLYGACEYRLFMLPAPCWRP